MVFIAMENGNIHCINGVHLEKFIIALNPFSQYFKPNSRIYPKLISKINFAYYQEKI